MSENVPTPDKDNSETSVDHAKLFGSLSIDEKKRLMDVAYGEGSGTDENLQFFEEFIKENSKVAKNLTEAALANNYVPALGEVEPETEEIPQVDSLSSSSRVSDLAAVRQEDDIQVIPQTNFPKAGAVQPSSPFSANKTAVIPAQGEVASQEHLAVNMHPESYSDSDLLHIYRNASADELRRLISTAVGNDNDEYDRLIKEYDEAYKVSDEEAISLTRRAFHKGYRLAETPNLPKIYRPSKQLAVIEPEEKRKTLLDRLKGLDKRKKLIYGLSAAAGAGLAVGVAVVGWKLYGDHTMGMNAIDSLTPGKPVPDASHVPSIPDVVPEVPSGGPTIPDVTPEIPAVPPTEIAGSVPVPDGTGGEYLMNTLDLPTSTWYDHEFEFLQQYPDLTYIMPDGHVGLIDTSTTSNVSQYPPTVAEWWKSRS